MIEYLQKLINEHDPANSKIFMGLLFGAVTIIVVFMKVFIATISMEVLWFLGSMTGAFFGLSSIERFKGKDNNNEDNSGKEGQTT
jgi:cobalamin biosynthesis protein CobD/CbiB